MLRDDSVIVDGVVVHVVGRINVDDPVRRSTTELSEVSGLGKDLKCSETQLSLYISRKEYYTGVSTEDFFKASFGGSSAGLCAPYIAQLMNALYSILKTLNLNLEHIR